jgi:7,8-dihydroneopterin aldolase/epimerase/oxygenase
MIKKETPEGYACIFVRDITVDVRIGLHEHEHKAPQRLAVSVELYTDAVSYLKNISEDKLLDYERIFTLVRGWSERPHVKLIETYIHEVLAFAFTFEEVQAVRVSIAKPDIFKDTKGAGVEIFLTREEFARI